MPIKNKIQPNEIKTSSNLPHDIILLRLDYAQIQNREFARCIHLYSMLLSLQVREIEAPGNANDAKNIQKIEKSKRKLFFTSEPAEHPNKRLTANKPNRSQLFSASSNNSPLSDASNNCTYRLPTIRPVMIKF